MVQGSKYLGGCGSTAETDGVFALGDELGCCCCNTRFGGLIAPIPQSYRKLTTALDWTGATMGAIQQSLRSEYGHIAPDGGLRGSQLGGETGQRHLSIFL